MKRATLIYCLSLIIGLSLSGWTTATITKAQNSAQTSETLIPLEGLDPVLLAQGAKKFKAI